MLRSLPELRALWPYDQWMRYSGGVPKGIIASLHKWSHVKVWAQAACPDDPPRLRKRSSETIWLVVMDRPPGKKLKGRWVGKVNTITGRASLHGLVMGMLISFEARHIIDVGAVGA